LKILEAAHTDGASAYILYAVINRVRDFWNAYSYV